MVNDDMDRPGIDKTANDHVFGEPGGE